MRDLTNIEKLELINSLRIILRELSPYYMVYALLNGQDKYGSLVGMLASILIPQPDYNDPQIIREHINRNKNFFFDMAVSELRGMKDSSKDLKKVYSYLANQQNVLSLAFAIRNHFNEETKITFNTKFGPQKISSKQLLTGVTYLLEQDILIDIINRLKRSEIIDIDTISPLMRNVLAESGLLSSYQMGGGDHDGSDNSLKLTYANLIRATLNGISEIDVIMALTHPDNRSGFAKLINPDPISRESARKNVEEWGDAFHSRANYVLSEVSTLEDLKKSYKQLVSTLRDEYTLAFALRNTYNTETEFSFAVDGERHIINGEQLINGLIKKLDLKVIDNLIKKLRTGGIIVQ